MKICSECKHAKLGDYTSKFNGIILHMRDYLCTKAQRERAHINVITGKYIEVFACNDERQPFGWIEKIFGSKRCGADGRFWERSEIDGDSTDSSPG